MTFVIGIRVRNLWLALSLHDIPLGITGGTSCGKKTLCKAILEKLKSSGSVAVLSMESFYRRPVNSKSSDESFNYDHPDAFDFAFMEQTLVELCAGRSVSIPKYDFHTRSHTDTSYTQEPVQVLLLEGILVLHREQIRNLLSLKIFLDVDSDLRLSRRVIRDIELYNRGIDKVLSEYQRFVKPCFEEFTLPTKSRADIVIPRGADNEVAVDLIVQHIHDLLSNSTPGKTEISPVSVAEESTSTAIETLHVKGSPYKAMVS